MQTSTGCRLCIYKPVIHLLTPVLQFAIVAIATHLKNTAQIIICFFPWSCHWRCNGQHKFLYLSNTLRILDFFFIDCRSVCYFLALFFPTAKKIQQPLQPPTPRPSPHTSSECRFKTKKEGKEKKHYWAQLWITRFWFLQVRSIGVV